MALLSEGFTASDNPAEQLEFTFLEGKVIPVGNRGFLKPVLFFTVHCRPAVSKTTDYFLLNLCVKIIIVNILAVFHGMGCEVVENAAGQTFFFLTISNKCQSKSMQKRESRRKTNIQSNDIKK